MVSVAVICYLYSAYGGEDQGMGKTEIQGKLPKHSSTPFFVPGLPLASTTRFYAESYFSDFWFFSVTYKEVLLHLAL